MVFSSLFITPTNVVYFYCPSSYAIKISLLKQNLSTFFRNVSNNVQFEMQDASAVSFPSEICSSHIT